MVMRVPIALLTVSSVAFRRASYLRCWQIKARFRIMMLQNPLRYFLFPWEKFNGFRSQGLRLVGRFVATVRRSVVAEKGHVHSSVLHPRLERPSSL